MKPAKILTSSTSALVAMFITSAALAGDVQLYADTLVINKLASASAMSFTVSGPGDFHYRSPAGSSKASFGLSDLKISGDGLYLYELKQYTYSGERTVSDPANGRGRTTQKIVDSVKTTTGQFRVKNGAIVIANPLANEEGAQ